MFEGKARFVALAAKQDGAWSEKYFEPVKPISKAVTLYNNSVRI
jgi:hypothetical protein